MSTTLPVHEDFAVHDPPAALVAVLDRWSARAQSGDAVAVLADIAEQDARWSHVPSWPARRAGLETVAYAVIGDEVAMAASARQILQTATTSALEVLGHAEMANAAQVNDDYLAAVASIAEADALIDEFLSDDRHQVDVSPDWFSAIICQWLALNAVGLRDRAEVILDRLFECDESGFTVMNRLALYVNFCEHHMVKGLGDVCVGDHVPSVASLDRAMTMVGPLSAAADEAGYSSPDFAPEMWNGLYAAWMGDPAEALAMLDSLDVGDDDGLQAGMQALWHAARLHARAALGASEELRNELARASAFVATLPPGEHVTMHVFVLQWEHSRAQDVYAPDDHAVRHDFVDFALAHARHHERLLEGLRRAHVARLREETARERLARELDTDHLTGVGNRRRWESALDLSASQPPGRRVALVFADVDRFKDVNDRANHRVGDEVLRRIAEALTTVCRAEDTVARLGGDEFGVLVRVGSTDPIGDAEQIGERIISAVRAAVAPVWHTTISLGIAVRSAPLPVEEWGVAADAAMYEAKRAGGDRFRTVRV